MKAHTLQKSERDFADQLHPGDVFGVGRLTNLDAIAFNLNRRGMKMERYRNWLPSERVECARHHDVYKAVEK